MMRETTGRFYSRVNVNSRAVLKRYEAGEGREILLIKRRLINTEKDETKEKMYLRQAVS